MIGVISTRRIELWYRGRSNCQKPGLRRLFLLKKAGKAVFLVAISIGLVTAPVYATDSADEVGDAVSETTNDSQTQSFTVEKPRWEFGLAGAALRFPAYPSSSVGNDRNFLLPWFAYRSEKVRLQGGAIRLIALENKRVTVDVSLGGSLNSDSDATPLRAGMPDLDFLFEFGPKVDVRLWDSSITQRNADTGSRFKKRSKLSWSTALRFAISTDFSSVSSRGLVLGSELKYRREGLFGGATSASVIIGPVWATEKLMDYYYQIDPQFVTPERAAFDASAGYLGTNIFVGLGHRFGDNVSAFIGVNAALHSGARNSDSPLFEDETTTGIVLGLSWTIKQSKDTVSVVEEEL